MRGLVALLLLFLSVSPVAAASKGITYYFDGARVNGEVSAPKGYVEVPLPPDYMPGSFRADSSAGTSIERVEFVEARPEPRVEKELRELAERRRILEDRLKALDERREIFRAAAKSQSSKAPRRTKNNPEPMESIRKGTDYAVSQLEEVYRGRRRAEEGIRTIDARMEALRKEGGVGGSVARIWLSGKGGVSYSYLTAGTGWSPFYDFRLHGKGEVEVRVRARLPASPGDKTSVVFSRVAEVTGNPPSVSVSAQFGTVSRFTLPLEKEEVLAGPQPGVRFAFVNTTGEPLYPGDGACYLRGMYLGSVRFEGSSPGEVREMAVGMPK